MLIRQFPLATQRRRCADVHAPIAIGAARLRRNLTSERQQRLINLLINGLRILITAVATALFFRMLARPSEQFLARSGQQA
jgi:hypothetical protein